VIDAVPGIDRAYYLPDFLSVEEDRALVAYFGTVPHVEPSAYNPVEAFAFAHPVYDGVVVRGRSEAAAGEPIWFGGAAVRGTPMPPELVEVRDRAEEVLGSSTDGHLKRVAAARFTSVYVDHYEEGGLFVPHADRDCYGPIVVGVSIGPGSANLDFVNRDGAEPPHSIRLEPRSLYAFCGQVRWEPWLHRVTDVTGTRFAVSYRQPAGRG
jgi:hypothetical protein